MANKHVPRYGNNKKGPGRKHRQGLTARAAQALEMIQQRPSRRQAELIDATDGRR